MFNIGDKVRFAGRAVEQDNYHNDYKQLLGQVGTVVECSAWAEFLDKPDRYTYEVQFEGFTWEGSDKDTSNPADQFTVWHDELQAV